MSKYSEMSYAELQAAAKEAGLPANKTKDELLASLEAADAAPANEDAANTEEGGDTNDGEGGAEEPKPAVSETEVEKAWRTDVQKMKAHLEKQKKVSVMIPFDAGVKPEDAAKVPFVVNLNGYRYEIKRGVFVEVPEQIAQVVKERLESEGKIGAEHRIDLDPSKLEALG